jgi:hypothetical protein
MIPALWIGAVVVLAGAVAAFLIPHRARKVAAGELAPEVALAEAA